MLTVHLNQSKFLPCFFFPIECLWLGMLLLSEVIVICTVRHPQFHGSLFYLYLHTLSPWSACSGHDCGVFVMVFMDLLCINGGVLCFSQTHMRQLREKCLADLLAGKIRNFPIMSPWLACGNDMCSASHFPSPPIVPDVLSVYVQPFNSVVRTVLLIWCSCN